MAAQELMATFCENESPCKGAVEVDESYFGRRQKHYPRDRGAYSKLPVFGLLKRESKSSLQPNKLTMAPEAILQAIIRGKVDLESIIHSDGWFGYDGLVDMGFKKH